MQIVQSWKSRVAEATLNRRAATSDMKGPIVATVGATAVWLGLSVVLVPGGEVAEFNFSDERGSVTVLSALYLAAASSFSLVAWMLSGAGEPRAARLFWFCAAAGLGLLAIDELLQIHERLGGMMGDAAPDSGPFRNWNDALVLLYGCAALLVGAWFLPVLLRYPNMLALLVAGFVMFLAHTVIDSISDPPTTLSHILEESAKLYTGAFLALAMLSGLLHIVPNQRRRTP
ncbi:MAG: hypothetical protein RIE53_05475 [Rhodothermales bacterium]